MVLAATFVDLLRSRSGEPAKPAFEHVGPVGVDQVGYAELDQRARAIGAALTDRGLADQRVLVSLPAGLDYIGALFGCWYAGAVAVPLPPLPASEQVVREVVADADPAAAIVSPGADVAPLAELGVTVLSTVDLQAPPDWWRRPDIGPDTLALLQYAGRHGIMVSHGNLVASARQAAALFGARPDLGVVSMLPPYGDLGLMTGVLQPIFSGGPATLVAATVSAVDWLRLVAERRVRIGAAPRDTYERAAELADGDLAGLDLSVWDVAVADTDSSTMDLFADRFAGNGFRRSSVFSCYWLAEATSVVAGRQGPAVTEFDADTLAPGRLARPAERGTPVADRGRPADELEVAIVDPLTATRCPDGTAGEIWLTGPNVAVGYLGQPEASERTFCARLHGSTDNFLRTGDLGFVHGGGLHVADRDTAA